MVSVAIPVYNGAKFINSTIKSVIKQTEKVDQILIVDDLSMDGIQNEVHKIISSYPDVEIKYYRNEKNLGYQSNWNRCFELCTTKFLIILHQDDLLIEHAIKNQLNFLKKNKEIALVGGLEDIIDVNGNLIKKAIEHHDKIYSKGNIYELITERNSYIPCSSVMFNMDKIRDVGYFDTDVLATDELYWPRVLTQFPIAVLGRSLILRGNHPEQTEWSDFINKKKEVVDVRQRFLAIKDFENREEKKLLIVKTLNRKFCKALVGISAAVIRYNGSSRLAFWYLSQVFKIDPLFPIKYSQFWKVVLISLINSVGLLNFSKKIKNKRFTKK